MNFRADFRVSTNHSIKETVADEIISTIGELQSSLKSHFSSLSVANMNGK